MMAQLHVLWAKGDKINVYSGFRQCDGERTRKAFSAAPDLRQAWYSEVCNCWCYNRDSHHHATSDHPMGFESIFVAPSLRALAGRNAASRKGSHASGL
jgi:hypothetical protein